MVAAGGRNWGPVTVGLWGGKHDAALLWTFLNHLADTWSYASNPFLLLGLYLLPWLFSHSSHIATSLGVTILGSQDKNWCMQTVHSCAVRRQFSLLTEITTELYEYVAEKGRKANGKSSQPWCLVSLKVIKCKVDCDSFNFNLQVSR